jgi:hypothetical protein
LNQRFPLVVGQRENIDRRLVDRPWVVSREQDGLASGENLGGQQA